MQLCAVQHGGQFIVMQPDMSWQFRLVRHGSIARQFILMQMELSRQFILLQAELSMQFILLQAELSRQFILLQAELWE